MIDPLVNLAFAIQSSPGLYALLLGSGLSRGAGVPTGWEIVVDLTRKIALLEGADVGSDPVAWYRARYSTEPDYSKLLEQLAASSAERGQLLRSYFEPTADEREQGIKVPSAAHRAIAELVAGGYIKVIVTTNFDRLIEQALEADGITPTVVSSADALEGMMPLPHVRCLVVKLHGDYHDTRIRNTFAELDQYDPRQNVLLDRILDEYGVVICGWSAEWDTALRRAFERVRNRRFSTFWTGRGTLGSSAQQLVTLRQAQVISIRSADEFFRNLADKVRALTESAEPHPISAKAAIAEIKRYLPEERFRIRLNDLMIGESNRVIQECNGPAFKALATRPAPQEFLHRLQLCDGITVVLRALLITGSYWGRPDQHEHWIATLERLANAKLTLNVGTEFGFYPTLLALYATGISAVAANRLDTLAIILSRPQVREHGDELPIVRLVYPVSVLNPEIANKMPGYDRHYTPLSDHLYQALRQDFLDLIPDEERYADCFDRFEYLSSLVYLDYEQRTDGDWSPIGRFGWILKHPHGEISFPQRIETEVKSQGDKWPLLHGGLFGGSADRFLWLQRQLNERIAKLPWF